MLILLPPSETKSDPRRGRPVDLAALAFPELAPVRRSVADALIATSRHADALRLLGVPPGAIDQVTANTDLWTAHTLPAARLYTGVLFGALDLDTLDAPSRRRATGRVVVSSALWGFSRLGDRLPAYRLSAGARLVGLGPVAGCWREPLASAMPGAAGAGVVVDCRSGGYAAMWRPVGAQAKRFMSVVVEREIGGTRAVVSHPAKYGRGLLARVLVAEPGRLSTPDEVCEVARAGMGAGWSVELARHESGRNVLTLVDSTENGAFAERTRGQS